MELAECIAKFEVQVVIEPIKDALEKARRDCRGLALSTDGSKLDQGNAGAAICWNEKVSNQWKEQSVFLGKNKEVLDAELRAILKGLEIALKILHERDAPVTIFCESQKALEVIQQIDSCNENRFLRNPIYQKAAELQRNGYLVTIRWIPGHTGLTGNEKADSAAKNRVQRGGKQAKRWSSLAYIRKNLNEIRADELSNNGRPCAPLGA